jgi:hypothetical protein
MILCNVNQIVETVDCSNSAALLGKNGKRKIPLESGINIWMG